MSGEAEDSPLSATHEPGFPKFGSERDHPRYLLMMWLFCLKAPLPSFLTLSGYCDSLPRTTAASMARLSAPSPTASERLHAERSALIMTFHLHHALGSWWHSHLHFINCLLRIREVQWLMQDQIARTLESALTLTCLSPTWVTAPQEPNPGLHSPEMSVRHSGGSYSSPHLMN